MLTATYAVSQPDDGLAGLVFTREQIRRGHTHFATRSLSRHVGEDVLGDAVVTYTFDGDYCREVVAEAGDVLLLLRVWRHDADICATASTPEAARAAVEAVKAQVGRLEGPRSVQVRFADSEAGTRALETVVRPWAEIAPLYPGQVRAALDELMPYVPDPDEARRLLLWHGPPGTGKTTAVRALLHEWREWAEGVVVTDPDRLLANGKYLRRLLLDPDDEDRWQLVVLEDADALLDRGAGPALGKLLNLADGLLGQGLRCLFLITTNQPVDGLPQALVRAGRCLARVEFPPLSAAEAARVLGRPVDRARTLAEVVAERTVTAVAEPVAVGQYL